MRDLRSITSYPNLRVSRVQPRQAFLGEDVPHRLKFSLSIKCTDVEIDVDTHAHGFFAVRLVARAPVAAIGDQVLDQLRARGLVLNQHNARALRSAAGRARWSRQARGSTACQSRACRSRAPRPRQ